MPAPAPVRRTEGGQGVVAVGLVAVEEVLGVVDDLDCRRGGRKATESPIMARFSSAVAPRTSVTCSSQLLPKMVMTGVPASTRAARFGS